MRSLNRAATIANLRGRPGRRTRRTLGARPAISVREGREEMPELVALRAQVFQIRVGRRDLDRHALGDVQAVALQPDDLLRVVGEEREVLHAQVDENLGADPVVAQVGLEAEGLVGFDGVLALILKLVRAHLVHETDPPPLLAHVHEHAPPLGLDDRECLLELRPAVAAARVKDLADQAGRVATREPREVHGRLGVAGAAQDAARHRPEGQDVAGARQVFGPHLLIHEGANRDRAVVGRGAGRDAASGVNGHGERGPHGGRVVRDHHRDLELVQPLAGHRHADEAAAVLGHEVDRLRRDLVGGHHEIALVLAVLVVNDHEDAPLADLLDRLLDGRKPRHVAPLSASDRTRYLPITSASTFVACPDLSRPRVVAPSVYGISITSKLMSPSPATVRLTPSTATDPWGISSGSSSRRGSPIRTRVVDSTRVTSSTVPTPSTCPRTRWPPRAPPNRSGRSRLTGSPGWSRPSVVRASVSGPSSKTTSSSRRSTTVRHAPFTATLAPTSLPSSVTPACTPSRSVVPARASATTVPISSTIPVNIYSTSGGAAPLPPTTPHRPPQTAASAHRLRRPRRRSNRVLSAPLFPPLGPTKPRPPPPGCRRRGA